MKFLKALVPALALVATVSHASDILDHKQAVRDTTKVRQVYYTCATGGRLRQLLVAKIASCPSILPVQTCQVLSLVKKTATHSVWML